MLRIRRYRSKQTKKGYALKFKREEDERILYLSCLSFSERRQKEILVTIRHFCKSNNIYVHIEKAHSSIPIDQNPCVEYTKFYNENKKKEINF